VNEDGLLNRARVLPKKHPAMFNFWFAPFLSVVNLYHPETAVSLLTSGGNFSSISVWILFEEFFQKMLTCDSNNFRTAVKHKVLCNKLLNVVF